MKTVGPAMSLRTSFWSLLQNEQRRISPSPAFFTMWSWSRLRPVSSFQLPASDAFSTAGSWQGAGSCPRKPQARLRMTSSIIPYSLPCSGPTMHSRSVSSWMRFRGCPVCALYLVQPFPGSQQLARVNVGMSVVCPPNPGPTADGLDSRIGREYRLPFAPAASTTAATDAAWPMQ